jgi:selenocysteine lyase/cysteine desulfurase
MPAFVEVAARVRQEELGRATRVATPYGPRLLCYADLTATGRAVGFVERQLAALLPYYANTHTALSATARVTGSLREQARHQLARGVHAGPEDEVLFVGSGATAAVNKLVGMLGLRIPEPLEREHRLSAAIPRERRPVVLAGPYEHHSNELPWLESIAELVEVALGPDGAIDLADLERKARAHRDRPLVIGAISAASNVTGVLTDVAAVARILHAEGAVCCVDYAAAGPYVPIDMHPPDPAARLDAVFLSVHKCMGGPGASGVLVAHRSLFRSRVPERPGGGTVDYVSSFEKLQVDYAPRLAEREEGGTPNILGDVRAGLAFALRELLGPERIREHELRLADQAWRRLAGHPRLRLLGPGTGERLPILSFNVEGLHHDLVSALLDQLFGIQNRAGCSCAGPYGHRLLGIDREHSAAYRRLIGLGLLGVKPGWVRISLPYYFSEADVDFVLSAVELLADEGEAFVPLYRLGWRDGLWRHGGHTPPDPAPLRVDPVALWEARDAVAAPEEPLSDEALATERARYLREARELAARLRRRWDEERPAWNRPLGRPEIDGLVWFRYVETDGP